jgi:hypothetical protein
MEDAMRTGIRRVGAAAVAWTMLALPALAIVIDGAKRWHS